MYKCVSHPFNNHIALNDVIMMVDKIFDKDSRPHYLHNNQSWFLLYEKSINSCLKWNITLEMSCIFNLPESKRDLIGCNVYVFGPP